MLEEGTRRALVGPRVDPLRGLSLAEIAKRAGVSRATAYHHFVSKENYLAALMQYLLSDSDLFAQDAAAVARTRESVLAAPPLQALLAVATADLAALAGNESLVWRPTVRDRDETGGGMNDQATAVTYLRVSTKEQAERDGDPEGYSIPAQRAANLRKAQELGAAVVAEFVDRGESARSADRPQLKAIARIRP